MWKKRQITLKRLEIMCTAKFSTVTMTEEYRMTLISKRKMTTISRQNIFKNKDKFSPNRREIRMGMSTRNKKEKEEDSRGRRTKRKRKQN